MQIRLDLEDGPLVLDDEVLSTYARELHEQPPVRAVRTAYAAAHVVLHASYADVDHALDRPGSASEIADSIDWDTTLALRTRLDHLGFGVAEAMDTANASRSVGRVRAS